jgi:ATP/maltotriose-dependent transcriptional regulator MalT/DNA-binding SARP family transcriptional activator
MMSRNSGKISSAKISRPHSGDILVRDRLHAILDSESAKPLLWITGPGGSGKSSLVSGWIEARKLFCLWYQVDAGDNDLSSFFYHLGHAARRAAPRKKRPLPLLTPEYLAALPVFARRFFEDLFGRLNPPAVVVFDNYQDLGADSPLHETLAKGIDVLPDGMTVIVLSREEPPPAYARLRAGKRVGFIGWNELRFIPSEIVALSRTIPWKICTEPVCPIADTLFERTDGWAAGLVLLLESLRRASPVKTGVPPDGSHYTAQLPELHCQGVFDYFAGELFGRTDLPTCSFLLKTALFPAMTVKMAERLTQTTDAKRILRSLSRSHFFIDWRPGPEPVYQYHPLFREFLLKTAAERFDVAEIEEIRHNAAALLHEAGMTGEAVELCLDAGAWDEAAELVTGEAEKLIMQGRSALLESWLLRFPESMFDERPWLLYWLGVAKLGRGPAEGRGLLQHALRLFSSRRDETGMLLAWAAATESIYYGFDDYRKFDDWIAWLDAQKPLELAYPSPRVELSVCISMVMALTARQPYHPDIDAWVGRLLGLFKQHQREFASFQSATIFAFYLYYWRGDFFMMGVQAAEIQNMAKSGAAPPLFRVVSEYLNAELALDCTGDPEACLFHARSALRIAGETGVMVLNEMLLGLGAYSAVLSGDLVQGEEFLARLQAVLTPERKHTYCHYYYLAAFMAVRRAEQDRARNFMRLALQYAEETGFFFPLVMCLTRMALLLHRDGEAEEADRLLERALALSTSANSAIFRYACLLEKSRFAFDRGAESDGVLLLTEALSIGAKGNYFGPLWWREPAAMARLCAKALTYGIEPDYARMLIRANRLEPGEDAPGDWPYRVKITTLGRFELQIDGQPLQFSGKVQKKPLELLKALVAFGGSDVPQERIIDALWPEAEGDTGNSSFKFTLHQLRKLLGDDTCIQVREGRVSVNHRVCHTDVWAFQRLADRVKAAQTGLEGVNDAELERLVTRAMELYRGDFLSDDRGRPWIVVARERLKGLFLRLVDTLYLGYERAGEWEKAARLCERGVETYEYDEDLYRRQMLCLLKLGRPSEALAVYNRCCRALAHHLLTAPSPETVELAGIASRRTVPPGV